MHPGCQYQYIDHTINTVTKRMSTHRSSILRSAGCKVLKDHFTDLHSVGDMKIMPIAPLPDNINLKQREELEDEWMLKLNTVFPYGLNVRVKKVGVLDATVDVLRSKKTIYSYFNVLKITRHYRGTGNKDIVRTVDCTFNVDNFYSSLFSYSNVNFRDIRTSLCNLKKKQLKEVYIKSIALLNERFDSMFHFHSCLLIKDLSWFYLQRMGVKIKKADSSHFCIIEYVNKFVEHINLKKIFTNPVVFDASPFKSDKLSIPRVSLKYPHTIRSKVLNYREVYSNEECDPSTMICSCNNSSYVDNHHGHIITGDLSIVTNVELRNLLQKGLNYRDQVYPSIPKALSAIKSGIINYCNSMASRYNMNTVLFREWQHKIFLEVEKQLNACKKYKYNSVLSKPNIIDALKTLHKDFVLVPTDKASNNITIVCKKFYLSYISKEFCSDTFVPVSTPVETILANHEDFLFKHGIKMKEENFKLPYIYITPKQHKTPIGFRVITSGSSCSLQQLSIYLGICLKSMLHSAKNKSVYDHKFHSRNDFYIIDSNEKVLDFLYNNNTCKNSTKSINTYDFSTLYTSIPHQQLKDNLSKFVKRVFQFKDKEYIIPNLYTKKAYFSNSFKDKKVCFSKDDILECLFYLIDNSFVHFRNSIFRQTVGIPMGTNAGPQVANTYLHVYEFEFIKSLIAADDQESLKKLENIFRFQDDLISFNDNGLLGELLSTIYPPEMIVNCTNISPRKCNYLDLCISIYRGKYSVSLYDKRRDFPFNVISYPFLDGNVPTALSYGIFTSQLVRFAKVNSEFKGFRNDVNALIGKLVCQGFALAALRKKFVKFYHCNLDVWSKYGIDIYDDVMSLFNI